MANRLIGMVIFLTLAGITSSCSAVQVSKTDIYPLPTDVAAKVANRIVEETTFSFKPALPKASDEGYMYLDFAHSLDTAQNGIYYARSELFVNHERSGHILPDDDLSTARFGISHTAGEVEIKLDGNVIYRTKTTSASIPVGHDYDRFVPATYVEIPELKGEKHHLSVKMIATNPENARIWLGFFAKSGAPLASTISFKPPMLKNAPNYMHFIVAGPVDGSSSGLDTEHPLASDILDYSVDYVGAGGKTIRWDFPRVHLLRKHADKLDYADWRYFTGTILASLYQVSDTFEKLDYQPYINQHMNFFLSKRPLLEQERANYGRLHSPFGHYFRYALLDDVGVTALPFAERLIRKYGSAVNDHTNDAEYEIANNAIDHILHKVPRLPDGTLGRLNPLPLTVWADDMFMGTGVLMKMAKALNKPSYMDEAIKQIMLIDEKLYDPETSVYWHGWFGSKEEPSSSKWGRANGWTIMAKTDALLALNPADEKYGALLKAFQRHAKGLLTLQSKDGLWHQILDNKNTYLETSASAMFIRAFAEGLRNGWLSWDEYGPAFIKGWKAVTNKIPESGLVEGIVKGTPIFFSDEQYDKHPTRLNDPRGLGAVLYMCVSVERLRKSIE